MGLEFDYSFLLTFTLGLIIRGWTSTSLNCWSMGLGEIHLDREVSSPWCIWVRFGNWNFFDANDCREH